MARDGPEHSGETASHRRLLAAAVALAAAGYAAFSLARHRDFRSGYDLGVFDQALWLMSRLEPPRSTVVDLPSVFGDHFHPILVLLAPLYRLHADPATLLVAQAILVAVAAVPVYLFARPRVGATGALLLAYATLAFWGLHAGVAFDFHELAFGPVLAASAVLAADRGRWWWYAALVVLLLAVKEDVAMLVVALGAYLAVRGERWRGVATALAGVAWFLLVTRVVIPHFGGEPFRHWSYGALGRDLPDALGNLVTDPLRWLQALVAPLEKVGTLAATFGPFLLLTLFSPLALLCVPLLAEKLLSAHPNHWGLLFHYSLIVAPLLAMGAADGLVRLERLLVRRGWGTAAMRPRAASSRGPTIAPRAVVPAAIVCGAVLTANVVLSAAASPFRDALTANFWKRTRVERAAAEALDRIPAGATVTAQSSFVPRLSERHEIHVFRDEAPVTDYLVANVRDARKGWSGQHSFAEAKDFVARRRRLYTVVSARHGFLLLRRRAAQANRFTLASGQPAARRPLPRRRRAMPFSKR